MTNIDLTVAVTAHAETVVAGPPMRSAEMAIRAAEAQGLRVERLIGLDTPSNDCRGFFYQPLFKSWSIVEFQFSNLSNTRNALAKVANGRWIAFLDADDLFSENWLAVGARLLAQAHKVNDKIIVHPELSWVFDKQALIFVKPDQNDPCFIPQYFYFRNYYDAPSLSPLAAHLETPYAPIDLSSGFGFEDWQWNIETMAAGWRHVVAENTVVFIRRRERSICTETEEGHGVIRAMQSMAIDNVAKVGKGSSGKWR
jgi:hypothetical protein